ncbi:hypothetical protein JKG68_30970 [Microvirga aerilata]|uniref:Uncharacterized protein n=1 Tax=Microvirga aerilata TaxID=670292 RepID=A0A936ZJK0_9HYPH|nr:hypothetical protein [Microvirga aerilata]
MAELVQQNAQEEQKNEDNTLKGCVASTLRIMCHSNPDKKEKKGKVDTDDCALYRANRNRPAHILSLQGIADVGTPDLSGSAEIYVRGSANCTDNSIARMIN